jgi:hypothetical protein
MYNQEERDNLLKEVKEAQSMIGELVGGIVNACISLSDSDTPIDASARQIISHGIDVNERGAVTTNDRAAYGQPKPHTKQ